MLLPTSLAARGTSEESWQDVEGIENWTHEIDISEFDEGTYNVIVRGRDPAGNEVLEGPINITIDPASDLPESRIVFPEPGGVVRGDLNVLGVAADDDGLSAVEVRLDDGSWIDVEAGEYWRHEIPQDDIDDGGHTLYTRAVDVNGLAGNESSISFVFDTRPPQVEITSHEAGAIVRGTVRFDGVARDENGIASVELSRDGRETYENLRPIYNQGEDHYTFWYNVPTTGPNGLDDGPIIYWLRVEDDSGAVNEAPYLFFVDNRGPTISVISPQLDQDVDFGEVRVVGAIRDAVGIESFVYRIGQEEVEIPLEAGNPYWSVRVDTTERTARRQPVEFVAVDTSGNQTRYVHPIVVDQDQALPRITLDEPTEDGASVGPDAVVYGSVGSVVPADVVIVEGLGDEPVEYPAFPAFAIPLADAPSGNLTLRLSGRDEEGRVGPAQQLRLTKQAAPADVRFTEIRYRDGETVEYFPGVTYDPLRPAILAGELRSDARIGRAEALIGEETPQVRLRPVAGEAVTAFELDLPSWSEVGVGNLPLDLEAEDSFGTQTSARALLSYRDLRRIDEAPGFVFADERLSDDGTIRLSGRRPFEGLIVGAEAGDADRFEDVRLEPVPDFIDLTVSGRWISLSPNSEGSAEGIFFRATDKDGFEIEAGPFSIASDSSAPVIEVTSPAGPDVSGADVSAGVLSVRGTVTDDAPLSLLEYSTDGGRNFTEIEMGSGPRTSGSRDFGVEIDLGTNPPDGIAVAVRATDVHGNVGRSLVVQNLAEAERAPGAGEDRNNDAPRVQLLMPNRSAVLSGTVVLGGVVRDLDGARVIEVAIEDGEFRRVLSFDERRHHQTFLIDLGPLDPGTHNLRIRATDRLGEAGPDVRTQVTVASPRMSVALQTVNGENARSPFFVNLGARPEVVGIVENAERLTRIRYRLDADNWTVAPNRSVDGRPTARSFSFLLPPSVPHGRHTLAVEATDREGNVVVLQTSFYVVAPGAAPAYTNDLVAVGDGFGRSDLRFAVLEPIVARFDGRSLAGVRLEAPADSEPPAAEAAGAATGSQGSLVAATVADNRITLTPTGAGVASGISVVVETIDGVEYRLGPWDVIADLSPPEIVVPRDAVGSFVSGELSLPVEARDDLESLDVRLRVGPTGNAAAFRSESLDLSGQTPGPYHLFVIAEDGFGKVSEAWIPVFVDFEDPTVRFIAPSEGDVINGRTSVFGVVDSFSDVVLLEYSLNGETYESTPVDAYGRFLITTDFSALADAGEELEVRARDRAGNTGSRRPRVSVDADADRPVAEIQIPQEDAVVTGDFLVSGMVFDDDGIAAVYRRIDDGEFLRLPGANNFSINVPIESLTDNEHVVEVYAEDVYGLAGPVVSRRFRVSLRQPDVRQTSPTVDETTRGIVTLRGESTDANGVDAVALSLDNGNSRLQASGGEQWEYSLDTRVFTDGTYSVQSIATDAYGIEGSSFTLINIDNTAPDLTLDLPADGSVVSRDLDLSGRVSDAVGVDSLTLELAPIGREGEPLVVEIDDETVVQEVLDVSEFPEGWYNLQLTAEDAAANRSLVARNIYVQDQVSAAFVALYFPQVGDTLSGPVAVEGRLGASVPVERAQIVLNGVVHGNAPANKRGYFRYTLEPGDLQIGENTISAVIEPSDGERVVSSEHGFDYQATGPHVSIDSHSIGDFAAERPWIEGVAGYTSNVDPEDNAALRELRVNRVLVSLDNGRNFEQAQGTDAWRYRLETQDIPEGPLAVLVRAEYQNGEAAITRTMLTIDKTAPELALRSPFEGVVVNERIRLVGTASDANGVTEVQVALREGDKAGYAVPSFVQGMYIDGHALGITYFQVGLGLTFFDQNVKLQAQFGMSPETATDGGAARFAGYTIGGKILANVASIPFNALFGPDWDFLSLNVALGATFNYIILYEPITPFGMDPIEGVVLSAIIGQIEFPKVTFADATVFNAISAYVEPQLWFIPSDVRPDVAFRLTFGLRVQLF